MKIVDSHTHVHELYDKDGRSCIDWMREYQKKHFPIVNVCALSSGAYVTGKCNAAENIRAAIIKANCEGVFAYGGLSYPIYPLRPAEMPEGFAPLTQYEELMEIGFDGLKSFENKPSSINALDLPVSDPMYDDFYAAVERDGTHMVWHVADPERNWTPEFLASGGNLAWYCGEGRCIPWSEIYDRVYNVLERYPRLSVTFAHFFFLSDKPEKLEELFKKYPNLCVDLTPGTEMYDIFVSDPAFYRDFLIRHDDRILFGTDCTFDSYVEMYNDSLAPAVRDFVLTDEVVDSIWGLKVRGFKLPEASAKKILSENFLRYHKEPKPVNKEALWRYIEKYLPTIESEKEREETLAFAKKYL